MVVSVRSSKLSAICLQCVWLCHGETALVLAENALQINRFQEPPTSGLMCDLLWSDPIENFGSEANEQT